MLFDSALLISGEALFLYPCLTQVKKKWNFKDVGRIFEYLYWKGFQEAVVSKPGYCWYWSRVLVAFSSHVFGSWGFTARLVPPRRSHHEMCSVRTLICPGICSLKTLVWQPVTVDLSVCFWKPFLDCLAFLCWTCSLSQRKVSLHYGSMGKQNSIGYNLLKVRRGRYGRIFWQPNPIKNLLSVDLI